MAYASFGSDELCTIEEDINVGSITCQQRRPADESTKYKSKNLHAERRRRQKLSDKLLLLRSIVPIITNMNKASIINDAITFIQQLEETMNILKDELQELNDSSTKVVWPTPNDNILPPTHVFKTHVQNAEVRVIRIDEQKVWIKIVFEKKKGGFSKIIEALNSMGFEAIDDMSLVTVKGAVIVTTIINGKFCKSTAQQTEDLLLHILNGF